MLRLDQKKTYQSWKRHCSNGFCRILRKSVVSRNSKVYYGRFLRNGLHERHCYISKSRSNVQYLEVSWPLFIGREMRQKWMVKVLFAGDMSIVHYVPPLIRGRLHLVRDTAVKKEVDTAIQMTLKYVNSEIQENIVTRRKQ